MPRDEKNCLDMIGNALLYAAIRRFKLSQLTIFYIKSEQIVPHRLPSALWKAGGVFLLNIWTFVFINLPLEIYEMSYNFIFIILFPANHNFSPKTKNREIFKIYVLLCLLNLLCGYINSGNLMFNITMLFKYFDKLPFHSNVTKIFY